MLSETIDFLDGMRHPADMLGNVEPRPAGKRLPLVACGDMNSECWRTGSVPKLACSKCKCVRYCRPEHQKAVRYLSPIDENPKVLIWVLI